MFTSRDVAERAGVSQSTVSYVMSGKRSISNTTRERVLAVMAELTYQPNAGARALASQRTQVIGLVAPLGATIDASGLLPFLETIASSARERDYDVLLVTVDEGPSALTRLAGRRICDAIVVMEVEAHDERVAVARSVGVPVIFVGVPDDASGLWCVDVDFTAAGRMAVDELVATGHRRILVVGHDARTIARDINYVRRFERGVEEAAARSGVAVDLLAPVEATSADASRAADWILAARGDDPIGVVVPNTDVSQALLTALTARGLALARDVSVIGLCTDAAAVGMVPPLTNVSLEPRDVSRRTMNILFRRLERAGDAPPSGVHLVQSRLTRRATSPGP